MSALGKQVPALPRNARRNSCHYFPFISRCSSSIHEGARHVFQTQRPIWQASGLWSPHSRLDFPAVCSLAVWRCHDSYPDGLAHPAAAEAAGYSHSSGTWSTYLSRLRSLDLIDGRGELKAQGWLFP
jgi:hypothetical protein